MAAFSISSIFCSVLLVMSMRKVDGDLFTSVSVMERMLGELKVSAVVEKYIEKELQRHETLRKMVADYEAQNQEWLGSMDLRVLQNPVAAYSILKHLSKGWVKIEQLMRSNAADEIFSGTSNHVKFLPNISDVEGAAVALSRLLDVYNLDTEMIADGSFPGVPYYGTLSAKDCFDIGMVAYDKEDHYHAVLWFEEALKRLQEEGTLPTIEEADILAFLTASQYEQGLIPRAITLTKRWLELEPNSTEAEEILKEYEAKLEDIRLNGTIENRDFLTLVANGSKWSADQNDRNVSEDTLLYEALCRGEKNQPSNGICYYKKDKPTLRLAPIKVEVVHANPDLILFRDVISPKEIEDVKTLATPKLHRSEVVDPDGASIASYRISANAWLEDEIDPLLARITRRIGDMIDLDMEHAELAQIANYGLGGHYEVHHDCGLHYMKLDEQTQAFGKRYKDQDNNDPHVEDRIATYMFYLVQPVSGGATVFPKLNISVFPTAGDAVFWYNVLKNGYEDPKMVHAACPVLTGSKWVFNKWISIKNQEFNRPCALTKDA